MFCNASTFCNYTLQFAMVCQEWINCIPYNIQYPCNENCEEVFTNDVEDCQYWSCFEVAPVPIPKKNSFYYIFGAIAAILIFRIEPNVRMDLDD